jgi:hypothetical protein
MKINEHDGAEGEEIETAQMIPHEKVNMDQQMKLILKGQSWKY